MSPPYEPQDHIRHLEIAPRTEGILSQREITIRSYQATVPFDFDSLNEGVESAWLTPQIRFGVFSRVPVGSEDSLTVVLGLQDELTVRAYDYDARRPLWYSWQDAVVDTVNVHYFQDEKGSLRFTSTGGGRRISDNVLHDFNSTFLAIPRESVSKRQFDLKKLRDLCFGRFADHLYTIKFSDPSGEEYRSIDHAQFQSRKYIDPSVERLQEIISDEKVTIESFDSDVRLQSDDLATAVGVRFFIRGLQGSLRLRFPKLPYKKQFKTADDLTRVFYRIVDTTVSAILDADYYACQTLSLEDLDTEPGRLLGILDLGPFREVLTQEDEREKFVLELDLSESPAKWSPHLQALDELLRSGMVGTEDIRELFDELVARDPRMSMRLLDVCQKDANKHRVGGVVARALADKFQAVPTELRAQVEETVLAWAVDQEQEAWDVDVETNQFQLLSARWSLDDVSLDALPVILWKLTGVLHARLKNATADPGLLLRKFHWCMTAAKGLPEFHSKSPAALRLVAAGQIPRSISEADGVLKRPVANLRALDEAILDQFGLPLWPFLTASVRDGNVQLSNEGIGAALVVKVEPAEDAPGSNGKPAEVDLAAGKSIPLQLTDDLIAVGVHFEKFGKTYQLTVPIEAVPIEEGTLDTVGVDNGRVLPVTISRKRLAMQKEYRASIDPQGIVVGSSPALLAVFERIHHANLMDETLPVLLLGEPGVGKTHIAQLLHESSKRASKEFKVVNAGGGGGDINIQRGEWIGYGKSHGIQGIDANGRPGHLLKANGGTLFVDEFASLSHDLQVIFLSVLEKRSIEKVGGESFNPDVRCVFATNADVERAVENGTLRRDLLDRIPIKFVVPPLRQRRGDILLLARHFDKTARFSKACRLALLRHNWPGNIRELKNRLAAATARLKSEKATVLKPGHFELPHQIKEGGEESKDRDDGGELWRLADEIARGEGLEHGTAVQSRAAKILGVGPSQASKMYKRHGLSGAGTA